MKFIFAGMNTLADPASFDPKKGQCVDICNCDLDDEHNAIRRDGYALAAGTPVTSCWTSSSGVTYCVSGGRLARFDGTAVSVLTEQFTVLATCEFEQVNDVVVFSDGEKIGIISGTTVTRIDNASDWSGVASLESWVTSHWPVDPATYVPAVTGAHPVPEQHQSNFEVDAFKLATLPGTCLHHFNGTLYLAIGTFVYATKAFDIEHMDIRHNVVAGFPDPVTMINSAANGLFVGTTAATYFLAGTGLVVDEEGKLAAGFTQSMVAPYGAVYGSDIQVHAGRIPALQSTGMALLWSTRMGIFAGLPGGVAVNLSADKVTLPDASSGTAIFREHNGLNQYLFCCAAATWVLNLMTGTHSRYDNFPFTSLFRRGTQYYGANSDGIFRLEGDADYAGIPGQEQPVNAHILTPSSHFGRRETKRLQGVYVEARCRGELALDYYVDEVLACDDDVILFDDRSSAHARRAHPPRGLRGMYWQLKLKNVNGAHFAALGIEPLPLRSERRT